MKIGSKTSTFHRNNFKQQFHSYKYNNGLILINVFVINVTWDVIYY